LKFQKKIIEVKIYALICFIGNPQSVILENQNGNLIWMILEEACYIFVKIEG